METIEETIDRMIKERKDNHRSPPYITCISLRNERARLDDEQLNELYKSGKIELIKTLNDFTIKKRD